MDKKNLSKANEGHRIEWLENKYREWKINQDSYEPDEVYEYIDDELQGIDFEN